MYEFENFVYLDVQKTGSSFIASLLKQFCNETKIRRDQHKGLEDWDRSKLYFISVRDPFDQYASLYSFGCASKGNLFGKLRNRGLGDLYDGTWEGFRLWLKFILDPGNAELLNHAYANCAQGRLCRLVGFQSYRILSLSIPNANEALSGCDDRASILAKYRADNVVGFTIRYENFRVDLEDLLKTHLKDDVSDLEGALRFVREERPHNSSGRIDKFEMRPKLSANLKKQLCEREWLMYEELGYTGIAQGKARTA